MVIAIASLPDHGRTVVQMVITDISERARENRELERSRRTLRSLSANMVQAREDERRRIARELHDELGQRLTALKMELSSLGGDAAGSAPAGRIDAMLEMVDDTVATVRRIATELRPLMLDDLGLNAAIEWLADGWSRRMGVADDAAPGRRRPGHRRCGQHRAVPHGAGGADQHRPPRPCHEGRASRCSKAAASCV